MIKSVQRLLDYKGNKNSIQYGQDKMRCQIVGECFVYEYSYQLDDNWVLCVKALDLNTHQVYFAIDCSDILNGSRGAKAVSGRMHMYNSYALARKYKRVGIEEIPRIPNG